MTTGGFGDGGSYDAIRKQYYDSDKAKQTALRDEIAADFNVCRGVTVSRQSEEFGFRLKRTRSRWDFE